MCRADLTVFSQVSIIAIMAFGMTFVLMIGQIDLSVGSIAALSGLVLGVMLSHGVNEVLSIIIVLVVGGLAGLFNGFVSGQFNIPTFIVTVATMGIFRGIGYTITDAKPIQIDNSFILSLGNKKLFDLIPVPVLIVIALLIFFHIFLSKTAFGRRAKMVGGNKLAAEYVGVNTKKLQMKIFVISGIASAISGMILASRLYSAQPNAAGGYELDAIAAAVLGGTSLSGGYGTVLGTFIGALIMGVINNGMNLIGMSYFYQQIVKGLIIGSYIKTAGGKGINVSKVLKQLGNEVVATGFLGGTTGQFIKKELESRSIAPRFIEIEAEIRNCIAILSNGSQTEILEAGPTISNEESHRFLQLIADLTDFSGIKVISASGSIPQGLGKDYYRKIIEIANSRNVKFVLDTSGDSLKKAIKASPYLIKPNISEIEGLFNAKIASEQELVSKIVELKREYQIQMIVVSLGKNGSIALCGDELYRVTIPEVEVKNPIGSGDALVAGMVSELAKDSTYEEILRVGNTCGVLNAMSAETGSVRMEDFSKIYDAIRIQKFM